MMQEVLKEKRRARPRLTKYLRLTTYNFLDFETTLSKLAILSRNERKELLKSGIARAGKSAKLKVSKRKWPECWICTGLFEKAKVMLSLADTFSLIFCLNPFTYNCQFESHS